MEATSSLPVPDSPRINTGRLDEAKSSISRKSACIAALRPMIRWKQGRSAPAIRAQLRRRAGVSTGGHGNAQPLRGSPRRAGRWALLLGHRPQAAGLYPESIETVDSGPPSIVVNVQSWRHPLHHLLRFARLRWAFANLMPCSRFPIVPYGIVVISPHRRHCNWRPTSAKSALWSVAVINGVRPSAGGRGGAATAGGSTTGRLELDVTRAYSDVPTPQGAGGHSTRGTSCRGLQSGKPPRLPSWNDCARLSQRLSEGQRPRIRRGARQRVHERQIAPCITSVARAKWRRRRASSD